MIFVESSATGRSGSLPFIADKFSGHSIDDQIVETRRCTVQMQNGFLYLDVLASHATALLGHDRPEPETANRGALIKSLARLHADYDCLAVCADAVEALLLAKKIGSVIAGDAQSVRVIGAEAGEPENAPGIVVAVESETVGRSGVWLASAEWRNPPSFIIAGNVLAAGEPFGALFVERRIASRIPANSVSGFTPPSDATIALVQATIDAVSAQRLVEKAKDLAAYFHNRLESVRASCSDIAEIQVAGLSARIRLNGDLTAAQLKRRLCERGMLAGVDDRGWLLIRPPLAIRLAEIDVISGVLRGALLGTAMARTAACCAACETEGA